MARPPSNQPTEVELAILKVLWQQGPSLVGRIHRSLVKIRQASYATTLKMVQVMYEKGLLVRDESQRPHIYGVAKPEEETQLQLMDYLAQKAFGGSMKKLVMSAIHSKRISANELAEIRKLIEESTKDEFP